MHVLLAVLFYHRVFLLFYEQIDAMFGEDGTPREMLPKVDTGKLILEMCQFAMVAKTGVEFEITFGSSEHVLRMKCFPKFFETL